MTTSGSQKKSKPSSTQSSKRSTSGLNCTDLCQLIETAGKSGVRRLSYGDLEIDFSDKADLVEVDINDLVGQRVANSSKMVDNEEGEEDAINVDMSIDDINELALTDPIAYEQIQAGGEISA